MEEKHNYEEDDLDESSFLTGQTAQTNLLSKIDQTRSQMDKDKIYTKIQNEGGVSGSQTVHN